MRLTWNKEERRLFSTHLKATLAADVWEERNPGILQCVVNHTTDAKGNDCNVVMIYDTERASFVGWLADEHTDDTQLEIVL